VNPTILDFIPENVAETNLSMKMVVSKEKDKIGSLFNLICSLKSQSAIVFCNHRDAERISDTLNEKEFMPRIIMVEWIRMKENALIQFRNGSVSYSQLIYRGLDIRNESCYSLSFAI
jgi:hypothetical protein